MSSSGVSAVESQEKNKQIKLRGNIAKIDTQILQTRLIKKKIELQKEKVGVDAERVSLEIEKTKFSERKIDLNIARNNLEIKSLGLQKGQVKLGIAQDELRAISAERTLQQSIMAEGLNNLALQASDARESNRLRLNELKALYNRAPSLKATL